MIRPIFYALIYLISGIVSFLWGSGHLINFGGQPSTGYVALFFVLIFVATVFMFVKYKWIAIFVFPLFFAVGFCGALVSSSQSPLMYYAVQGNETFELTGYVYSVTKAKDGRYKVIFAANKIAGENAVSNRGTRVVCYFDSKSVSTGMRLTMSGKLRQLDAARNPGAFDEYNYYMARKIRYKLDAPVVKSRDGTKRSVGVMLSKLRERLSGVYDKLFPESEAAIIKSIILGDKSELDDDIVQLYQTAGIYHILCVSGLHIGILIFLLDMLLSRYMSRKKSAFVTIILIALYCVLTGGSVSVVRASLMGGVILGGRILNRDSDLIASVSFSCIALLFYEPLYILDIGFQLSFASAFGIAFLTEPFLRILSKLMQKNGLFSVVLNSERFRGLLAVTAAVTLSTAAVVDYYYFFVTPYSILVNIIIIPTAVLIVTLGMLTGLCGLVFLPAAYVLAAPAFIILLFYRVVCEFFVSLPFSLILTGSCGLAAVFVIFALIVAFAYVFTLRGKRFVRGCILLGVATLGFLAAGVVAQFMPKPFSITMLDVGQGDSFVIEKDNTAIVIDGGGKIFGGSDSDNTGMKVLLPYLQYRGIRRLDAVFVSHVDYDHAKGITELAAHMDIGRLYMPGGVDVFGDNSMYMQLTSLVPAENRELLQAGDTLEWRGIEIQCVYPKELSGSNAAIIDTNDASLVLHFGNDDMSVLFTGDIGKADEDKVLKYAAADGYNIRADVLKVAHHGSKGSSGDGFIKAVAPRVAIVSTGRGNSYGHPSAETVDTLGKYGAELYNTADYGAVRVYTRGGSIHVRDNRYRNFKYIN